MNSLGIGEELQLAPKEEKEWLLKKATKVNNQKTYKCFKCRKRTSVSDCYYWINDDEGGSQNLTCGDCTLDGMLNNLIIMNTEELQTTLEADKKEEE